MVEDGAGAIDYFQGKDQYSIREVHPIPDLVILDLKMPKMSGFQVLQWLDNHPDFRVIPTIVWSSSADVHDLKQAYCLGANAYLRKPSEFESTEKIVRHLLDFWGDTLRPVASPHVPTCEDLIDRKPF